MRGYQAPSTIRIPRKVICDKCGNPFETTGDETICTQCMIKPSRRPTDFPAVQKEMIMPQPCKPKECIDCHKTYTPTLNVQKRCPDCMKAHKPWTAKPPKAPEPAPHPFGKDVKHPEPKRHTPAAPSMTVACTMQDTIAIFHALAEAGCTCLVFNKTKITIEAL